MASSILVPERPYSKWDDWKHILALIMFCLASIAVWAGIFYVIHIYTGWSLPTLAFWGGISYLVLAVITIIASLTLIYVYKPSDQNPEQDAAKAEW